MTPVALVSGWRGLPVGGSFAGLGAGGGGFLSFSLFTTILIGFGSVAGEKAGIGNLEASGED